jgi:hypothetical protein
VKKTKYFLKTDNPVFHLIFDDFLCCKNAALKFLINFPVPAIAFDFGHPFAGYFLFIN